MSHSLGKYWVLWALMLASEQTQKILFLRAKQQQRKNYKDYWITEIYELSNGDGTRYYLTLENANKKIKLGSTGSDWEVIKNQEKQ